MHRQHLEGMRGKPAKEFASLFPKKHDKKVSAPPPPPPSPLPPFSFADSCPVAQVISLIKELLRFNPLDRIS